MYRSIRDCQSRSKLHWRLRDKLEHLVQIVFKFWLLTALPGHFCCWHHSKLPADDCQGKLVCDKHGPSKADVPHQWLGKLAATPACIHVTLICESLAQFILKKRWIWLELRRTFVFQCHSISCAGDRFVQQRRDPWTPWQEARSALKHLGWAHVSHCFSKWDPMIYINDAKHHWFKR